MDHDMRDGQDRTHRFDDAERRAVYRAIYERRDIRSHFTSEPISDEILARLLDAAHHAPSVGLMQPWGFILVRDPAMRRAVHDIFSSANHAAGQIYDDEQRALYTSLKLAGILEAPINMCIVCDPTTMRGHGLGRQTMPETSSYSAVCAVQNLWLAARAEGIGVGLVSILDVAKLRALFHIPDHVVPIAYLCIGHVSRFESQPELITLGWERRASLASLLHFEHYGATDDKQAMEILSPLYAESKREGR